MSFVTEALIISGVALDLVGTKRVHQQTYEAARSEDTEISEQ